MLSENNVIGSASILEQDMTTNTHLSPWLANIYICKSQRGKGLGMLLVKEVLSQAKKNGLNQLYLFTSDQARFYKKMGWAEIKQEIYQGKNVSIMSINLSDQDL
jgi:N-acetylglutamate synthase-like GNAT family acetyltransferase